MSDALAVSGNYYRFSLEEDTADRGTLIRVEPTDGSHALVHLHDCRDDRAFGVRFGYAHPDHRPQREPRRTVTLPAADEPGLTTPERVLARVGRFLVETSFGSDEGEIYHWPFAGWLPNDEWLLHLTVLSSTYKRLGPARRSGVLDDARVRTAVGRVADAAQPHAEAMEAWLTHVRKLAPGVRARWDAEMRERTVQRVLHALGEHAQEDLRSRPNPTLPRIAASGNVHPSASTEHP